MTEIDTSLKIYKSLADRERIRIMSILCKSDSYVELLAEMLELTPATVCYHLKKLEGAGLVKSRRLQHYVIYSADREILERSLGSFLDISASPGGRGKIQKKGRAQLYRVRKAEVHSVSIKKEGDRIRIYAPGDGIRPRLQRKRIEQNNYQVPR